MKKFFILLILSIFILSPLASFSKLSPIEEITDYEFDSINNDLTLNIKYKYGLKLKVKLLGIIPPAFLDYEKVEKFVNTSLKKNKYRIIIYKISDEGCVDAIIRYGNNDILLNTKLIQNFNILPNMNDINELDIALKNEFNQAIQIQKSKEQAKLKENIIKDFYDKNPILKFNTGIIFETPFLHQKKLPKSSILDMNTKKYYYNKAGLFKQIIYNYDKMNEDNYLSESYFDYDEIGKLIKYSHLEEQFSYSDSGNSKHSMIYNFNYYSKNTIKSVDCISEYIFSSMNTNTLKYTITFNYNKSGYITSSYTKYSEENKGYTDYKTNYVYDKDNILLYNYDKVKKRVCHYDKNKLLKEIKYEYKDSSDNFVIKFSY